MTTTWTCRALLRIVRKEPHILPVYVIRKRSVSHDTLAGIPWMSHSRITKTIERVSNEGPYDRITWERLSERANKISDTFDMKEMGRILYAYSKVNYRDLKIILKFSEKIKKGHVHKMDMLACAHICHSLNVLNYFDRKLFELILSQFLKLPVVHNSNSFALIVTLNAFSKHCNDYSFRELTLKLLIFVLTAFSKCRKSFTPQGLAMLLNCFSQVTKPTPHFLQAANVKLDRIHIQGDLKRDEMEYPCGGHRGGVVTLMHRSAEEEKQEEEEKHGVAKNAASTHEGKNPGIVKTSQCLSAAKQLKRYPRKGDENDMERNMHNYAYNQSVLIEMDNEMLIREGVFPRWERDDTSTKCSNEKGEIIQGSHNNVVGIPSSGGRAPQGTPNRLGEATRQRSKQTEELKNMFLAVLLEITKEVHKMNTQSLSLIINACCRIWFDVPREFLKIIFEETIKKIQLATIRHLSLIINGFIKLGVPEPAYLSAVLCEIEKKVHSCDEQQLSFILSGMVKLGWGRGAASYAAGGASYWAGAASSTVTSDVAPNVAGDISPNLVGGSVLSRAPPSGGQTSPSKNLLDSLTAKFILLARRMNISTLCNILYCYTKLGIFHQDVYQMFEIYFVKQVEEANLHHLALAAYVVSKRKIKNDTTSIILKRSESLLEKMETPLDMPHTKCLLILVNSFSELGIYSRVFYSYLRFVFRGLGDEAQHGGSIGDGGEAGEPLPKWSDSPTHVIDPPLNMKLINSKRVYLSRKAVSMYGGSLHMLDTLVG
ncbi:hypothetical protein C922_01588 [Plasmodium inui San Antonio 1]|uniref:Uncharacterized protein n=1 Tax=Plasmodium inui San Antonio 1 TaxID=1237626 RepID=W7AR92_9APIC|nr:hypothetical protein C922_01588 [Plasmodium inui San Antonio 1]EUD67976.1 hypothetical protein C922_01588 [Plasmodium inui San Antonio 1]